MAPLTPVEVRLLSLLRESDMDGYTLLKRASVAPAEAVAALTNLRDRNLVRVEGYLDESRVGETYFWISPEVKGFADQLTGKRRSGMAVW